MYYKKLIDDLLHELSYRSTEGYPILSKKEHQSIISEILTEWGDFGAKEIIMNFLTEGPKVQEADETGYTHIGAGVYVRSGDVGPDGTAKEGAQKYSQDESGRFSPISEDDYETMKSTQGAEGEDAAAVQNAQTAAQAGGGEAGVDGGDGGGQPEEPQTGTSLKDPSYQDLVKREKEVQKKMNPEASKKEDLKKEKEIQKNLSKEQKSARTLINKIDIDQLAKDNSLSDEEINHIQNFVELQKEFLDNNTTDDRKKEIALQLVDEYGLTTNRPITDEDGTLKPVKLYVKKNHDGGKNKRGVEILLRGTGKWGPSNPMTNMVQELNKYLPEDKQIQENTIGGKNERVVKQEFETAAKPSFSVNGGKTSKPAKRRNPLTKGKKEDPNNPGNDKDGNPLWIEDRVVSQIFKKGSVFGDLKESMHSLEGPADNDGNLIPCDSPENQRKHFDFLINNNESFERVKQTAQKFINDPSTSEADKEKFRNIIKTIDSYKDEMNKVMDKVPSQEANKRVKELGAKLMDDIHNAHPDIASGMAKQFAENVLVTEEIAAGDEVYMPSSGTFPGGDKIVVTRNGVSMESVAGVSVKFGRSSKETQIYGFPGEAQSMANFCEPERKPNETDEQFESRKQDLKTRNGRYVGQDGNLLGVRDDIVTDENKFNEVLSQSGMNSVVKDKKKLFELNNKIHAETQRWMEEQRNNGVSEETIRIGLQKHMTTWMKENGVKAEFEECIDRSELNKQLSGSTDGTYTDEEGNQKKHTNSNLASGCNPLEFLGIMSFTSSVKEGKGMPSLQWNHQSYENGKYHGETIDPVDTDMTDMSNWGFSSRLWVTSGRDGGGMLATGTGEGKRKQKPLKNVETED